MAINPQPNKEDSERREKLIALSKDLGLHQMQADVDSLKDNITYLRTKMEEIIISVNGIITAAKEQVQAPVPSQTVVGPTSTMDMNKITQLTALMEGVGKAYAAYKGVTPQTATGLDLRAMGEEFIGLLMKTSMDKLLISTYDIHLPPPKQYIQKITQQSMGHEPA